MNDKTVHLFRGAPAVRSWSKYQHTDSRWTLCGINRQMASRSSREFARCIGEAEGVSCPHCLTLMRPSGCSTAVKARKMWSLGSEIRQRGTDTEIEA